MRCVTTGGVQKGTGRLIGCGSLLTGTIVIKVSRVQVVTKLIISNLVGRPTLTLCAEFPNTSKVISFGCSKVSWFDVFPICQSSRMFTSVGYASRRLGTVAREMITTSTAIAGAGVCTGVHREIGFWEFGGQSRPIKFR